MTNDNSLIKLDSIKKVFYTDEVETHALSGIHLGIGKGEYISIAGPSGCAKPQCVRSPASPAPPRKGPRRSTASRVPTWTYRPPRRSRTGRAALSFRAVIS